MGPTRYTRVQRQQATWLAIGSVSVVCGCMFIGYLIKDQTQQYQATQRIRTLTLEQQAEILEDQKIMLLEKKRILELKLAEHFRDVEERRLRESAEKRKAKLDKMKWEAARMRYGARMRGQEEEEEMLKRQHDEILRGFEEEEKRERREKADLEREVERRVSERLRIHKEALERG